MSVSVYWSVLFSICYRFLLSPEEAFVVASAFALELVSSFSSEFNGVENVAVKSLRLQPSEKVGLCLEIALDLSKSSYGTN